MGIRPHLNVATKLGRDAVLERLAVHEFVLADDGLDLAHTRGTESRVTFAAITVMIAATLPRRRWWHINVRAAAMPHTHTPNPKRKTAQWRRRRGAVAASVRRAAHASLSLSLSPPLLSPSLPLSLSLSLCADLRVVPRDQDLEQAVRVRTVPLLTIKGGETFRVSIFFLSSLGGQAPHVRPVGVHRTCGEPNEIELTAIGVKLSGS